MKRPFLLVATTLLATIALADGLETELKLETRRYVNFLQKPDASPQLDVNARALTARLRAPVGSISDRLWAFAHAQAILYDEFDQSTQMLRGGIALEQESHGLELSLGYNWDRPSLDTRDELDPASGVQFGSRYVYRLPGMLELKADILLREESFESRDNLNNRTMAFGPSLRSRAFGEWFSPEVGVTWTRVNFSAENSDYDQRDLWVKLRSGPTSWLYLTARYRYRTREYGTADLEGSNYRREDTRHQLTLSANVLTGRYLAWNVYYTWQDADSTKSSRIFASEMLSFGLTFRFGR